MNLICFLLWCSSTPLNESVINIKESPLEHDSYLNIDKSTLRNNFVSFLGSNTDAADYAINSLYSYKETAVECLQKNITILGNNILKYQVFSSIMEAYIREDGSISVKHGKIYIYSNVSSLIYRKKGIQRFCYFGHYPEEKELFEKLLDESKMRISEYILYKVSEYTDNFLIPERFIYENKYKVESKLLVHFG